MIASAARSSVAALALGVAGCGLNPPDPAPLIADCANTPVPAAEREGERQFFFMSSALPDCRDGGLKLANYRFAQRTFGSGTYEVVDDRDVQAPIIAKHSEQDWYAALEQALAAPEARGRLIVFIHGYATDFNEAHKDGAGVRLLTDDTIPLVVLHWPSRNKAQDYLRDRASISWAQDYIDATLARLTALASDITLVTHSMGAKAGTATVIDLERMANTRPESIRRIVLASPDFDRDLALRPGGTIDQLLRHDRKILVYASREDRALQLSSTANGYARLGSTSCKDDLDYVRSQSDQNAYCHLTIPREGLAIVATGNARVDGFLRHNDFLDSCEARADLKAFLAGSPPPPYRIAIEEAGLTGFRLDPTAPFPDGPCRAEDTD